MGGNRGSLGCHPAATAAGQLLIYYRKSTTIGGCWSYRLIGLIETQYACCLLVQTNRPMIEGTRYVFLFLLKNTVTFDGFTWNIAYPYQRSPSQPPTVRANGAKSIAWHSPAPKDRYWMLQLAGSTPKLPPAPSQMCKRDINHHHDPFPTPSWQSLST